MYWWEFGQNPCGIHVESGWIRIHVDLSEFGWNSWNLVRAQVKFGWVLTDMIFIQPPHPTLALNGAQDTSVSWVLGFFFIY